MRPNIATVPAFYQGYVELVKDMDLLDALALASKQVQELLPTIPEEAGTFRYQEGKWTIKEVLVHMMDAERVFAYRALTFSRNDQTALPPFDENAWAPLANAHQRTIAAIGGEMRRLRETTLDLFKSFSKDMLLFEGTASGKKMSALNLGYITAGHDLHHLNILRQRYLIR